MVEPTYSIAPVPNALQRNELYFQLYLRRIYEGPHSIQSTIAHSLHSNKSFGTTVINDWPLYDGFGLNAKLIARAQGLHTMADLETRRNWYNSLTIVFEDDSFKGSTLQVSGPVVEGGQWAIIGGTGEFPLAQGVIHKKVVERNAIGDVTKLDIHAFYIPVQNGSNCWSLGK
ncbi:Dirigent protein 11 [Carex littledalei]|uniref:Dirigent protein n=1 Tax=Carex littledalei TaxID=544730 RepID=A0A833VFU5_9POAL|nr:Dirigent protein 11 [Carex littledalei]